MDRPDIGARPPQRRVNRRQVVRGAAWTLPTIVLAGAAPAYAASPKRILATFTANGTFTFPVGCASVDFSVQGGEGGHSQAGGTEGALLTGTITRSPSSATSTLSIVVGKGGAGGTSSGAYAGGAGFGRGGATVASASGRGLPVGAGGGGSAILAGTTPLVVAGGGGGGASGTILAASCVGGPPTLSVPTPPGNTIGASATQTPANAPSVSLTVYLTATTTQTITAPGGTSAVGATGGVVTAPTSPPRTFNWWVETGNSGSNYVAGSGGNGGAARTGSDANGSTTVSYVSGAGGGGGYAGGSAGNAVIGEPSFATCGASIAPGGGAGSNYAAPGGVTNAGVTYTVSGTAYDLGPRSNADAGTDGQVIIYGSC